MKGLDLSATEALWATAALNAKIQDRRMDRTQLKPVQKLDGAGVEAVSFFDQAGTLGISALALLGSRRLYFTTGDDLQHIDLLTGAVVTENIPDLSDIHEINLIGNSLWLANTGFDEALEFDTNINKLIQRLPLAGFRPSMPGTRDERQSKHVDRFHCNQIFRGLDGHRYALVHHVTGFQFLHKIAERLIKSHGHGGVLNLDSGIPIPLGLKAPHSVRVVADRYFICDSGSACVRVYDRHWRLLDTFETRGFGRGAVWSETLGIYYVGISATRARYLGVHRGPSNCQVQAFSVETLDLCGQAHLPHAEQISNLYLMPRMLDLGEISAVKPDGIASK